MSKHLSILKLSFVLLWLASTAAKGSTGESITLDPKTGDYIIKYMTYDQPQQAIFVPATKISPFVKSGLELSKDWQIHYSYGVKNGKTSKQYLNAFRLDPVANIVADAALYVSPTSVDITAIGKSIKAGKAALRDPSGWDGAVFPSVSADTSDSTSAATLRISWTAATNAQSLRDGIAPDAHVEGFGFASQSLPGIGIAQLSGDAPINGFQDDGPDGDVADKVFQLQSHDYVERLAAVPTVIIPSPYYQAELIRRIEAHAQTWVGMNLVDAGFLAQLDRLFQAAVSDVGRDNTRGAIAAIGHIRTLLKKEHEDVDADRDSDTDDAKTTNRKALIDKLAARVLDFDLKYVSKRLGSDD